MDHRIFPIVVCVLVTGAIYWFLSTSALVNPLFFPEPKLLLSSFNDWYASGDLLKDVLSSALRVTVGATIGIVAGALFGGLGGLYPKYYNYIEPIVEFTRVISPLAWIPFAILLFGIGDRPAIVLVAIASFFPTFTATSDAFRSIPVKYLEVARLFQLPKFKAVKIIYFPYCLPQMITGMKVSIGIAWYVLVAAEMLGAQSGLGYVIQTSKLTLQIERIICAILVIGVMGICIRISASFLERVSVRKVQG